MADTSALARLRYGPVAAALGPMIEAGLVATCGVIEFELGVGHQERQGLDELRADRDAGYEWLPTHDEDWRRALGVQAALWRGRQVRAVGFPDLLTAAVAERERVTVLHNDSDFDLIARVTGPAGAVDSAPRDSPMTRLCVQRRNTATGTGADGLGRARGAGAG